MKLNIWLIKTINGGEASEDDKDFMKIKFESDDDLSLGRILKLHMLTVIVRSVFEENGKYQKKNFRWLFVWVIKMQHNIKQINIKNRPW